MNDKMSKYDIQEQISVRNHALKDETLNSLNELWRHKAVENDAGVALAKVLKDNSALQITIDAGTFKACTSRQENIDILTKYQDTLLAALAPIHPDVKQFEFSNFESENGQLNLIYATPEELALLAEIEAEEKREHDKEIQREHRERIRQNIARSGLPSNTRETKTLDTFKVSDAGKYSNKEAYRLARQFTGIDATGDEKQIEADQEGYHNFLSFISKQKGTGKTHLAMAIAWHYAECGETVKFWQTEELLDALRASFNKSKDKYRSYDGNPDGSDDTYDKIMAELKEVGVLILDDLGAQKDTEFALAKLDMVINYRYINELQTVITANVDDIDELPPRIASRLSEGNVCKINMPDFRKIKSDQRTKNLVKVVKDVSN